MTPKKVHDQQKIIIEGENQLFASEDYDHVSDLVQEGSLIKFELTYLFQFIYMNAYLCILKTSLICHNLFI